VKTDRDNIRIALVLCGAVPLLYFWHAQWIHAALLTYLLTAGLFGVVLVAMYPPFGTNWFWRSIIPIVVGHLAIIFAFIWLDLEFPDINKWTRALYGFAVIILAIEWRLAILLIETLEPHKEG
jgi:hypothetical protein